MQSKTQTKRSNSFLTFALVAFSIFLLLDVAQATFKKPPFNGSIFGKRANGISDYDNVGRTLSSLCEVAVEACSVWFPQLEAKKLTSKLEKHNIKRLLEIYGKSVELHYLIKPLPHFEHKDLLSEPLWCVSITDNFSAENVKDFKEEIPH